jgi:hypothetical protein
MMDNENNSDSLLKAVEEIRKKEGRIRLSDMDLIVLAADEISRTFTYEEKNYSA